jgi:acetyl esterase/lipase
VTTSEDARWAGPVELGTDGSVFRALTPAHHRGTVLVLPGGGYVMRADYEGDPVAEWLAGLGIASGVVDYTVPPTDPDALVASVREAVTLARDADPDSGPVGVLGFSAGGHLAGLTGTRVTGPERPDALVLCYPGISLVRLASDPPTLGLLTSAQLGRAAEFSLEHRVDETTPPTFMWHTSDDEMLDVDNVYHLAQAYAAARVPLSLHVFPHGRHGLGLATDDPTVGAWTTLCAQWLHDLDFGLG